MILLKSVFIIAIAVVCILPLILPDIHATLYNNQQIGFSMKYPLGWHFNDFSFIENNKENKIVYFDYYEEGVFPKADINELWTYEGGDISEIKHAGVLVQNIHNTITENDEDYGTKLFDLQYADCLISHSEKQDATCNDLLLLENKKITVNGNNAHQIKYSWTERYTFCDYSDNISYPVCSEKTFDNISIITDIITNDNIWRINSFFRSDMTDFIEMEVHDIIHSLKILEKTDNDLKIPSWVKNNAGWWATNTISDNEFISTIQFLVNQDIIVLDKAKMNNHMVGNLDSELVIYQSKLLTQKEPFSVLVIQATNNDVCVPQEKQNTKNYGQITEYMLKKNLRDNPTEVIAVCMQLGDIKESTYPLILKELEVNRPNLIIVIGNIEANFESYYDVGAYGWWACLPVYDIGLTTYSSSCGINIIVVCECDGRYDDYHEGAIWTLSHEISHYMLFEQNYSSAIFADNVHWVESSYQACRENNSKENECNKLYESFAGYDENYDIMNIQYLKNSRNIIQNQISQEIHSLK